MINSTSSYIDYIAIYKSFDYSFPLTFLVYVLFLAIYFLSLWTIADSVFIPILNTIIYLFKIPDSIAGMTILAFGNGSPDVFSTISTFSKGVTRLGLGELLGAGIIVSIMTVGIISILKPTKLSAFAVNRDLGFFLGALMMFGIFLADGKITLGESIVLIMYYGIYILVSISVAYYLMEVVEEEVQIPSYTRSPTDLEVSTLQNADAFGTEQRSPEVDASSPSELSSSILQDPDFDAEYFLGTQEPARRTPIKRYGSNSSNLSFSSWQRRAYETRGVLEVDLDEDAADFVPAERDHSPSLEIECRQTFNIVFPIYLNWNLLSPVEKILAIIQTPLILLLNLTLPVMDKDYITKCEDYTIIPSYPLPDPGILVEVYRLHYPRLLLVIQTLLLPIVNVFLRGGNFFTHQLALGDIMFEIPLWQLAILLGMVMSTFFIVYFAIVNKAEPINFKYFLISLGFCQTITYLLMISNELVQLFEAIALFTNIKPALLGLTIFALGNSLSDVVTNTSVARGTSPITAISACYGGPLFSKSIFVTFRHYIWCWDCIVFK
jgi:solute carrier family 24 (sodium/potassium/calcium exchanger), member 6